MRCCDVSLSCQQKQDFEFWLIIQLGEFQSSLLISRRTTVTQIVTQTKQNNRGRKHKISIRKHCTSHCQAIKCLERSSLSLTFAATTPKKHKLQENETRCGLGRSFPSRLSWGCLEMDLSLPPELMLQSSKACCYPFVMPHYTLVMPQMYFETCFLHLLIYTCIFLLTSSLIISTYKQIVSPWLPDCLAKRLQVQLFVRNAFVEKTHPTWEGRREKEQCNIFPLLLLFQPVDHC